MSKMYLIIFMISFEALSFNAFQTFTKKGPKEVLSFSLKILRNSKSRHEKKLLLQLLHQNEKKYNQITDFKEELISFKDLKCQKDLNQQYICGNVEGYSFIKKINHDHDIFSIKKDNDIVFVFRPENLYENGKSKIGETVHFFKKITDTEDGVAVVREKFFLEKDKREEQLVQYLNIFKLKGKKTCLIGKVEISGFTYYEEMETFIRLFSKKVTCEEQIISF